MRNAFDLMTRASRQNKQNENNIPSNTAPKLSNKSHVVEKRRRDKQIKETTDSENEDSGDDVRCNAKRAKRLRKRTDNQKVFNLETNALETNNVCSGKFFSIGNDESFLKPKPRKSKANGINDKIESANFALAGGMNVPRFRKGNSTNAYDSDDARKSSIVLPKSIASATAKEIDRLSTQIVELKTIFPEVSSIQTCNLNLCDILESNNFSYPLMSMDYTATEGTKVPSLEQLHSMPTDIGNTKKMRLHLLSVTDDDSREKVKNLESQHRELSIRPMLRHFHASQELSQSGKPYIETFSPTRGEDMIGLSKVLSSFSSWLITYSLEANQMLETIKSRTHADDDQSFLFNLESTCIAVVLGPSGIGKTCFVRSAAYDINYKVVEVNTSQCRSYKSLISQLRDGSMTQQVSAATTVTNNVSNPNALLWGAVNDATTTEQESRTLILVDDADIALLEDSNFYQAICTLAQMSHKPVVLTISNENCLQNFRVSSSKLFRLPIDRRLELDVLLRCVCIAKRVEIENHHNEIISAIANQNNFHRALNCLQLVLESGKMRKRKNSDVSVSCTNSVVELQDSNKVHVIEDGGAEDNDCVVISPSPSDNTNLEQKETSNQREWFKNYLNIDVVEFFCSHSGVAEGCTDVDIFLEKLMPPKVGTEHDDKGVTEIVVAAENVDVSNEEVETNEAVGKSSNSMRDEEELSVIHQMKDVEIIMDAMLNCCNQQKIKRRDSSSSTYFSSYRRSSSELPIFSQIASSHSSYNSVCDKANYLRYTKGVHWSNPDCVEVWPGDTDYESSVSINSANGACYNNACCSHANSTAYWYKLSPIYASNQHKPFCDNSSVPEQVSFSQFHLLPTANYFVNSTIRHSKCKYCELYPYMGCMCIVSDHNKTILAQLNDSRKHRRYIHHFDSCNLGYSDSVKDWLSSFYSFN